MIVDQIKKRENKLINNKNSRIDIPVGKWVKCENCGILQRNFIQGKSEKQFKCVP